MATKLNITHTDIYTDLRSYLLELFPDNEVIQGYSNNVPLPKESFILMNIINESDAITNVNEYDKENGEAHVSRTVEMMMQIDFYGEHSGENARIFANLWRDYHASERLTKCQPLFCDAPKYMPLSNETSAFETRWLITAYLNYNPTITHEQSYVSSAAVSVNPII